MLRSYKYRLYPTASQRQLINKHIGACRFVYNLALECKQLAYAGTKKNVSVFELLRQLTDLKNECVWLREVDSQALQQSIINLDKAFTSFFKGQNKFPNFKKNRGTQSFRNPHGIKIRVEGKRITVPKFTEGIRFVQDKEFHGQIRSTTISRASTGKYFISVLVETGKENPKPKKVKEDSALGIDLGLKHFIVTSEGVKVDNPKHLQKALSKLKYLQRQASKKKKGGANRKKANRRVALQYEYVGNQRKDFLHKLSTKLISENQALCFEDLNIEGMRQNRNLAQSISSASWATFVTMCKYKAEWYGKNFLQIPTFQASTKICSKCGATNHNLTLADREWTCANCLTLHDRDINAAVNIKNYSLKNYCGGVRRGKPVEMSAIVESKKQELSLVPYSKQIK